MTALIAVIDIGKTNAKLMLVEAEGGATRWSVERPSPSVAKPGFGDLNRQLDVQGIEVLGDRATGGGAREASHSRHRAGGAWRGDGAGGCRRCSAHRAGL